MILGMICARGGSKGVPRKNMKFLGGYPLINRTINIIDSDFFDNVIVSTEDEQIAAYCSHFLEVQKRPPALATDTASKWDVFRYIAECNPQYDILVDLDTGCPLRAPEDITNCIEKLKEGYDVVVTAYEADRNPYFNMVRVDESGTAWVIGDFENAFNGIGIPRGEAVANRQQAPKVFSLSPSVFAIRREALFKYNHWSRANLGIVEIPRKRGIDIDTQDDWDYVEYLLAKG